MYLLQATHCIFTQTTCCVQLRQQQLLCPSCATLCYLGHHHAGAAASDQEKALQHSLLTRVLTDAAPEAPPHLLVSTAAVLISATVPDHSQYTTSPGGWVQDRDDDLQLQMDDLARGEFHRLAKRCQVDWQGAKPAWLASTLRLALALLVHAKLHVITQKFGTERLTC